MPEEQLEIEDLSPEESEAIAGGGAKALTKHQSHSSFKGKKGEKPLDRKP